MTNTETKDYYITGLKRCPLCGAYAAKDAAEAWAGGVFIRRHVRPAGWGGAFPAQTMYTVRCGKCDLTISRADLNSAVEIWNRRQSEIDEIDREELERMAAEDAAVMTG